MFRATSVPACRCRDNTDRGSSALLRTENIVKICYAYSAVNYPVHLVCRDTAGRAAAYIVDVSSEALLKRTVVEKSAEVLHRTRRITVGAVFKHVFEAIVEHYRVLNFCHCPADYTRLPQGNPVFQTALDNKPLRRDF